MCISVFSFIQIVHLDSNLFFWKWSMIFFFLYTHCLGLYSSTSPSHHLLFLFIITSMVFSLFSHPCRSLSHRLILPFHQVSSSTHWGLLEQVACGRLLPCSACRLAGGCLPVCVSVCVKICMWNVSVNACVQAALCICSVLCQFVCVLVCPALIEQGTGEELSQSRWLRKTPARWRFCNWQWLPRSEQAGNMKGGMSACWLPLMTRTERFMTLGD